MFWSSTIEDFVDSVPFVEYYSPFWGPKAISLSNPKVCLRVGRQDSQFRPFWPISLTITQFWGTEVISRIDEPRVRLSVGHQHSLFWPIVVRFVYYYSLFWGPRAISTINKSWDAFTFLSSTLPVLADSGLFHGLLLTLLGSRRDFHV